MKPLLNVGLAGVVALLLLMGCEKRDPTLDAAPPASPGAIAPAPRTNKPLLKFPGAGGAKPAAPAKGQPPLAPR